MTTIDIGASLDYEELFGLDELLDATQVYGYIRNLAERHDDMITVIPRGNTRMGLPILEIVVSDPKPGPKVVTATNMDPHPMDERSSLMAGMTSLATAVTEPSVVDGQRHHYLFSSPTDLWHLTRNERHSAALPGWARLIPRNADVQSQSGWSVMNRPSHGFLAVEAMLTDAMTSVAQAGDGSFFALFVSGHERPFGYGSHFLVDGPSRTQIARAVESCALGQGEPLSTIGIDVPEPRPIAGTRFCFRQDTAARRREFDPTVLVSCSDDEMAQLIAKRVLGHEINIFKPELLRRNIRAKPDSLLDRATAASRMDQVAKEVNGFIDSTVSMLRCGPSGHADPITRLVGLGTNYFGTRTFEGPEPTYEERLMGLTFTWRRAMSALEASAELSRTLFSDPTGKFDRIAIEAIEQFTNVQSVVGDLLQVAERPPFHIVDTHLSVVERATKASVAMMRRPSKWTGRQEATLV